MCHRKGTGEKHVSIFNKASEPMHIHYSIVYTSFETYIRWYLKDWCINCNKYMAQFFTIWKPSLTCAHVSYSYCICHLSSAFSIDVKLFEYLYANTKNSFSLNTIFPFYYRTRIYLYLYVSRIIEDRSNK